jgi:hypothetical protein
MQVDGPFVDGELQGMSGRDLLNHVITKAAQYNILVMLDLHRLNDQFIPQLWYSDEHSVDDVLTGWDTVLGTSIITSFGLQVDCRRGGDGGIRKRKAMGQFFRARPIPAHQNTATSTQYALFPPLL